MALILVTGGIKRIGGFLTQRFLQKGHHVLVHCHHLDAAQQTDFLSQNPDYTQHIHFVSADLTHIPDIFIMLEKICQNYGVPDHLIHTASIFENDSFTDFSWDLWQKHRAIHIDCLVMMMHHFYQHRRIGQKISGIAFIDQRTHTPTPDFFSYGASKMMLDALVPLLSVAATPDMRFNAISPGPVLKNIRQSDTDFQQQVHSTPLQKQVSLETLADACLFLMTSESITGQTLTIDSGQHLDWRTQAFLNNKE